MQLDLPEASIPLAQAVILLATAPKSNSAYKAINQAMADVRAGKTGDIPRHCKTSMRTLPALSANRVMNTPMTIPITMCPSSICPTS